MRPRLAPVPAIALPLLLLPSVALGTEYTDPASAFDVADPFRFRLYVDYELEARRAAIKREFTGPDLGSVDGKVPLTRDLLFRENRHVLTPAARVGLLPDLELVVELPIVVSATRRYSFDQRATPCLFGDDPQGRQATCVDQDNSLTFRDGILPASDTQLGFDAGDPIGNFPVDSKTVFRSPGRSGLDQLHLGLTWAALNQQRDDTKPTWIIGAQYWWSIGEIMRFDRLDPDGETGVSRGVHELFLFTSLAKRTSWSEPYVSFYYVAPVGMRGTEPGDPDGSLFWDVDFGQESIWPQQRGGTVMGLQAIPYDDKATQQKIALELNGRIEGVFEGRGYSELWEVLAFGGDARVPGAPLVVDRDPLSTVDAPLSYPGVTTIESYLRLAGRVGVRGVVGENARFDASFNLGWDQPHAVTFADAGNDSPDPDDVVTPGTSEVNPLHVRIIDVTGRRYIVDDSWTYAFFVSGTMLF